MTSNRRAIALLLALSLAAPSALATFTPSTAFAQSAQDLETARELYRQGKQLRAGGRLDEALAKFKAAHDLGHTPVTGIELARTFVMVGQLVEAREICLGIARMPVASDETERSATARHDAEKLAEELKPRIPAIRIHVTGAAAGETPVVRVDGKALPSAMLDEPYKVNPGQHEVIASAARGPEVRTTVDVRESEARDVALEIPPIVAVPNLSEGGGVSVTAPAPTGEVPSPRSAPSASSKAADHPRNKLASVGFAIGGAGVVIGSLAGLTALSKKSTLDSGCKNKQCEPVYYDDLDAARSWGTIATVSFGVGAAGMALGIYALMSKKPATAELSRARVLPYVGAGTVGAYGSF